MKKYVAGALFVIGILLVVIGVCYNKPSVEKEQEVLDGINFKTEFENKNQEGYQLDIKKENPFKYLTSKNMDEVFKGNNIILLGYPESNVTRALIEQLLKLSKELDINEIYYYNVLENSSKYKLEIDEQTKEVKVMKEKDCTESFTKLTEYLNKYLVVQEIISSDGQVYKTDDKTLAVPSLIFVKDGKILEFYDKFPKKEQEEFSGFGETELEKLKNDIYQLVEKIQN